MVCTNSRGTKWTVLKIYTVLAALNNSISCFNKIIERAERTRASVSRTHGQVIETHLIHILTINCTNPRVFDLHLTNVVQTVNLDKCMTFDDHICNDKSYQLTDVSAKLDINPSIFET